MSSAVDQGCSEQCCLVTKGAVSSAVERSDSMFGSCKLFVNLVSGNDLTFSKLFVLQMEPKSLSA